MPQQPTGSEIELGAAANPRRDETSSLLNLIKLFTAMMPGR